MPSNPAVLQSEVRIVALQSSRINLRPLHVSELAETMSEIDASVRGDSEKVAVLFQEMIQMCLWYDQQVSITEMTAGSRSLYIEGKRYRSVTSSVDVLN